MRLTPRQRVILELLLEVPEGRRASDLERWRKSPAGTSGRNLEKALERAAEILGVGLGRRGGDRDVHSGMRDGYANG
ncbi:hypothetical protein ABZ297_28330 [Nonomuraea sp. NPDC005983]|uniref:hypothetical protein n=1 Tax=Nonomuraea sp. NPDC005983 TaxID=3155595 RepID=UPI0033BC80D9